MGERELVAIRGGREAEAIAPFDPPPRDRDRAPSLRSFKRMVPQVTPWNWVWRNPTRQSASSST
jgi:hypothetical protein